MVTSGEWTDTSEDVWGFRIAWHASPSWVDFTVCAVVPAVAVTFGGDEVPRAADTTTRDYCRGYVKWDGCMQLDVSEHLCGPAGLVKHIALLRYLWYRAHELMGRNPPTGQPQP